MRSEEVKNPLCRNDIHLPHFSCAKRGKRTHSAVLLCVRPNIIASIITAFILGHKGSTDISSNSLAHNIMGKNSITQYESFGKPKKQSNSRNFLLQCFGKKRNVILTDLFHGYFDIHHIFQSGGVVLNISQQKCS